MGKVYCHICGKRCKGDVLKVHDKFIHKYCFICCCCKNSLEKGGFFLKDGRYYCKDDYLEKFGVKCKVCTKIAEGEVIVIFGTTFHTSCFKCSSCSIIFQRGDKVMLSKERYFCQSCIAKQRPKQNSSHDENVLNKSVEIPVTKTTVPEDGRDLMTTSMASTIVSDSSENETYTPERKLPIDLPISRLTSNSAISPSKIATPTGYQSTDSERYSIRTDPELFMNGDYGRMSRYSRHSGSITSLKSTQSTASSFGRFFVQSFLKIEENTKKDIDPRAVYKPNRTNISSSSSSLHHFHVKENFSYRSNSSMNAETKPSKASEMLQLAYQKYPNKRGIYNDNVRAADQNNKENNLIASLPVSRKKYPNMNGDYNSSQKDQKHPVQLLDVPKIPDFKQAQTSDITQNSQKTPVELDPISASRTPSASFEPSTRTRYDIHRYTSPSRNLLNSHSQTNEVVTTPTQPAVPRMYSLDRNENYEKHSIAHSQIIRSDSKESEHISVQSFLKSSSRSVSGDLVKPKVFSYDRIKLSNRHIPRGLDRSRLETYLSDDEFVRLFKLSRQAFYRLPEWKRNDLKKRVDLF